MNDKSTFLITMIALLDVAFVAACEDVHPPVVSTPVEGFPA